jgi:UDP-glucose 4-epimerase
MLKTSQTPTVLVTGGAGFIGSHTVERLLGSGMRVRVLDNLSTGKRANLGLDHPSLELVEGDVRDRGRVRGVMAGVSRVVHLAAQVFAASSVDDPPDSASHNVMGFLNVLQTAKEAGIKHFVYASSVAVYGEPAVLPLTEDSPLVPLSPYGLEKRINEDYAALYERLFGFSSTGLRFSNVFGPRQDPSSPYSGVISRFVQQLHERQPLTLHGDGEQTRDFVYVSDVATAIVTALSSDYHGICNVGRGEPSSLLQLIDTLAKLAGYRPEIRRLPQRQGDIQHSVVDPGRLQKTFGVVPAVPLQEGLRLLWDTTAAVTTG